jgi:hypothetical protein
VSGSARSGRRNLRESSTDHHAGESLPADQLETLLHLPHPRTRADGFSEEFRGDVAHELRERTQGELRIGERIGSSRHPRVRQHIDQQEWGVEHVT